MPHLTVHDTLLYTAELRLPANFTAEERLARVREVLSALSLTGCADTPVGSVEDRGVSGGRIFLVLQAQKKKKEKEKML